MNKIRVGVIGLGVGEYHARIYNKDNRCELVALCDYDKNKVSKLCKELKVKKSYNDSLDLIRDNNIDLVSIASYDHNHYSQVIESLKFSKHVFVEKPICQSIDELNHIFELVNNKKVNISSNFVLRSTPRFIQLKDNIISDALGKVYSIEGDYNYGRIEKIIGGWRGRDQNYSIMSGGGIHLIDLLNWLINDQAKEVFAYGNKFCTPKSEFIKYDNVVSIIKYQNGAVGKISANFGCMSPHFHRLNVYGTKGTFEQNYCGSGYIFEREKSAKINNQIEAYPSKTKNVLINSFISNILEDGKSLINNRDIYSSMITSLSIEKSLISCKPVSVDINL